MKKWLWLAIAALAVIAALASGLRLGPLEWLGPTSLIERKFARELPSGTSHESVIAYFQGKGMPVIRRQNLGLPDADGALRGANHVCARAAEYRVLLVNFDVVLCTAFDDDGRLVEIAVRRSSDSV